MESLNDIKKILKGLAVSTQKEMTVGQFAHEYTSQTGKNLNYQSFGFCTLTEMIRSMKDTFKVVKVTKKSWFYSDNEILTKFI